MHIASRIRATVALSTILLVAAVLAGMGNLTVTLLAVMPGAWLGGWVSTMVFTMVTDAQAAARARRRSERRLRRSVRASTAVGSHVRLLTYAA